MSQEPLLFSCSILDNIRYGRPDASLAEVEAAAKAANALEFITNLPEGFDTRVGGGGWSGVEWGGKRISRSRSTAASDNQA